MNTLLEYGDGRMKTTTSIFAVCLTVFILSWFIIFGLGGALGIAVGASLAVISLALTIFFGFTTVCLYMSWLEEK